MYRKLIIPKSIDLKSENGFTLVEMLVTFLILGLLIGVLTPIFKVARNTWDTGRANVTLQENLHFALDFISREVRQAKGRLKTNTAPGVILEYKIEKVNGEKKDRQIIFDNVNGVLKFKNGQATPVPLTSPTEVFIKAAEVNISAGPCTITLEGEFRKNNRTQTVSRMTVTSEAYRVVE